LNESKFSKIPQLLDELSFVREIKPSGLVFHEDKVSLYVYLDHRRCNEIDGYIGLVPVNEETGKISLAGEANIRLQNALKNGETLEVRWRAPVAKSQNLKIGALFPYIFGLPLGVDGNFYLDKKDSTYLNMNYKLGIMFSFQGHNFLKAYYQYATSNILLNNVYTNYLNEQNADSKTSFYGIDFTYRKLDFLFNPRRGFAFDFNLNIGVRSLVKNNNMPEYFYDTLKMKQIRYGFSGKIEGYIPIKRFFVIYTALSGATQFGGENLNNELYKIGGARSLRGFDEESIIAASYAILTTEFRFVFSRYSYVSVFFNGAWYEKNLKYSYVKDFPYGFGIGLTFDTKIGIFGISYALGSQFGALPSFKSGKVHLGMNFLF
jgi:hypothetical protein